MIERTDWIFSAGEWRRPLGRRILAVLPSETGGGAWRVENNCGEEDSLDEAKAAAERRGSIIRTFVCHASLVAAGERSGNCPRTTCQRVMI